MDLVLKVTLSSEREYSFVETRKLSFLQIVLEAYNWRLQEESFQLLDHLAAFLAHPYKNTRAQIGLILNRIFTLNWHPKRPIDPRLLKFADTMVATLAEQRVESLKLTPEELLNNPSPYLRQSKTSKSKEKGRTKTISLNPFSLFIYRSHSSLLPVRVDE